VKRGEGWILISITLGTDTSEVGISELILMLSNIMTRTSAGWSLGRFTLRWSRCECVKPRTCLSVDTVVLLGFCWGCQWPLLAVLLAVLKLVGLRFLVSSGCSVLHPIIPLRGARFSFCKACIVDISIFGLGLTLMPFGLIWYGIRRSSLIALILQVYHLAAVIDRKFLRIAFILIQPLAWVSPFDGIDQRPMTMHILPSQMFHELI
jgi:hypothetical protein